MGGGRSADVDEVERNELAQRRVIAQQRDPVHRRNAGSAVHDRDDVDAGA